MSTHSRKSHETSTKKEHQPPKIKKTILTGEDSKSFAKSIHVPSRKRKTDEEIHKEEHKRRDSGSVKKTTDTVKKQHKSGSSTHKIPKKVDEVNVKTEPAREDLSSNIIDITGSPVHTPVDAPEGLIVKSSDYIKALESNNETLSTILQEKIEIIAQFKDQISKKDAELEQLEKDNISLKELLEKKHEQILEKTSKQQESSEKIIDICQKMEKTMKKNSDLSRSADKYYAENKKLTELNKKLEKSMDILRSECERHKKNDESDKKLLQELKEQNGKLLTQNSDLAKQLAELKSMPSPKIIKKEEPVKCKCSGISSNEAEHILSIQQKMYDKLGSIERNMDNNNISNTKFAKKNWGIMSNQINEIKQIVVQTISRGGSPDFQETDYHEQFERNNMPSFSGPRYHNYS
ncbi:intracellular protein transport protein USO1-like [Trichogramma pretiosum]|uniref:intracellular protein transport protein USO1-like n=1 Tax=Trichogramma pretiosum TaxID=7493 RepID=UPI0006C945F7|nr:intracellular protein transport protein USO1-like [Trichogramma pretiosum]XP_014233220.1 intracellular protein transport protein USO1-like [Trichogramma pretiosum]